MQKKQGNVQPVNSKNTTFTFNRLQQETISSGNSSPEPHNLHKKTYVNTTKTLLKPQEAPPR